jgi:transposase-like protein
MAGFLCDHCETTRTLDDRLTQRDFQREAYDFLLRHKHCRPVERVQ